MNKQNAEKIIKTLINFYPDAKCSLDFETPFQILVAVVLSAQCTDERVNKTTPAIFSKYPDAIDFVNMPIETLQELIHPCGFYKTKLNNFGCKVPETMEELMSIPGVGRKSANVIMLEAFNKPQGIAVDTHAKRISNRIGFSSESEPTKIEQDLLKLISNKYYKDVNHVLVWHGRNICTAAKPKCSICPVKNCCKFFKESVSKNLT